MSSAVLINLPRVFSFTSLTHLVLGISWYHLATLPSLRLLGFGKLLNLNLFTWICMVEALMFLENKKLEIVINWIRLSSNKLTFVAVTVYRWAVSCGQQFTLANSCMRTSNKGKSFSEFLLLAWINSYEWLYFQGFQEHGLWEWKRFPELLTRLWFITRTPQNLSFGNTDSSVSVLSISIT